MFYLVDLFWKPSTLLHNHKLCQSLGRGNSVLKFRLNLGKSIVGIYFFFYHAPRLVWSLVVNWIPKDKDHYVFCFPAECVHVTLTSLDFQTQYQSLIRSSSSDITVCFCDALLKIDPSITITNATDPVLCVFALFASCTNGG